MRFYLARPERIPNKLNVVVRKQNKRGDNKNGNNAIDVRQILKHFRSFPFRGLVPVPE